MNSLDLKCYWPFNTALLFVLKSLLPAPHSLFVEDLSILVVMVALDSEILQFFLDPGHRENIFGPHCDLLRTYFAPSFSYDVKAFGSRAFPDYEFTESETLDF